MSRLKKFDKTYKMIMEEMICINEDTKKPPCIVNCNVHKHGINDDGPWPIKGMPDEVSFIVKKLREADCSVHSYSCYNAPDRWSIIFSEDKLPEVNKLLKSLYRILKDDDIDIEIAEVKPSNLKIEEISSQSETGTDDLYEQAKEIRRHRLEDAQKIVDSGWHKTDDGAVKHTDNGRRMHMPHKRTMGIPFTLVN